MRTFNRRRILQGILAGGALTAVSPLVPSLRNRAHAHAPEHAFPTIFILLGGGLDPVMHWDAKTGKVNRNVQSADIRETAAGIRWYQPTLGPLGAHMEDCCLIRNIACSSGHSSGIGLLWCGESSEAGAQGATPWANYLSSDLLVTRRVPAPTLATFLTTDDNIRNLTEHSNSSPNATAAAQRVRDLEDFSTSLDVLDGMPDVDRQLRVYQHTEAMDGRHLSPAVQPRMVNAFSAGNSQATELLTAPPPQLWPPVQATRDAFDLSDEDMTRNVAQGNQRFNAHAAAAYEAARLQMSHVVFIQSTQGGYDTHNDHNARQRQRSQIYMPTIGRLLTALKSTESPVIPGESMFDTTHVVITSELSRGNRADNGDGTPHNNQTQAACFGGNFKRGYAFGSWDGDLKGRPADFQTGEEGKGDSPTLQNVQATILRANGVDPSGWTSRAPIEAVIRK